MLAGPDDQVDIRQERCRCQNDGGRRAAEVEEPTPVSHPHEGDHPGSQQHVVGVVRHRQAEQERGTVKVRLSLSVAPAQERQHGGHEEEGLQ